jgi:hypothetical protein
MANHLSHECFRRKLQAFLFYPWDSGLRPADASDPHEWRKAISEILKPFDANLFDPDSPEVTRIQAAIETPLVSCLEPQLSCLPPDVSVASLASLAPARIHPLDGKAIALTSTPTRQQLLAAFEQAVIQTTKNGTQALDCQELFKHCWRMLPKQFPDLPARFETPYVTIWQRQSIASALATTHPSNSPALFSFRVGGIQSFIDKARTTEDFWASSYLISWLTWQAARVIADKYGPDSLLFPALHGNPWVERWLDGKNLPNAAENPHGAFPNGLLALIPFESEAQARRIGSEAEDAFRRAWIDIATEAGGRLLAAPRLTNHIRQLWKRQVEDHGIFELFWVAVPRESATEKYADWYTRINRQIEGRKTLRNFVGTLEQNIKCHVCGGREALQDHEGYDYLQSELTWGELRRHALKFRFREAERLCAVCATCRLAGRVALGRDKGFPSTSSIAVAPFMRTLVKPENREKLQTKAEAFWLALRNLIELVDAPTDLPSYPNLSSEGVPAPWKEFLSIDGGWFFEEAYEAARLKKEFNFDGEEAILRQPAHAAAKALAALAGGWRDLKINDPANHLVLLAADGDQIGEWLGAGGQRLPSRSDSLHPGLRPEMPSGEWHASRGAGIVSHLALSDTLARFVEPAREIMQGLDGVLIYAGGDDFLGFAPVPSIAQGLSQVWTRIREDSIAGSRFSISAAALILPHQDPLSGAIEEVRRVLKSNAKTEWKRGAGVIAIRRQSGQASEAGMKFELASEEFKTIQAESNFQLVHWIMEAMAKGELSPRIASHFEELTHGLCQIAGVWRPLEAISRRRIESAYHGESDEMKKIRLPILQDTAGKLQHSIFGHIENRAGASKSQWERFVQLFLAARFLSRFQPDKR